MSDMRKNLKAGDMVVTLDGICGCVSEVLNNGNLLINIGDEVRLELTRAGVRRIIDATKGKITTLYFNEGNPKKKIIKM